MKRIKNFFLTICNYVSYPYYRLTTRNIDKKLTEIAENDRANLLTEKDMEFLRSINVDR